uniref:Uncharacterized protein n=1 Tax=Rhizophora mucronata TaxID=61149 RepID=A0A2P2JDA5_RHIMU
MHQNPFLTGSFISLRQLLFCSFFFNHLIFYFAVFHDITYLLKAFYYLFALSSYTIDFFHLSVE